VEMNDEFEDLEKSDVDDELEALKKKMDKN
jgi:hypothetical protein